MPHVDPPVAGLGLLDSIEIPGPGREQDQVAPVAQRESQAAGVAAARAGLLDAVQALPVQQHGVRPHGPQAVRLQQYRQRVLDIGCDDHAGKRAGLRDDLAAQLLLRGVSQPPSLDTLALEDQDRRGQAAASLEPAGEAQQPLAPLAVGLEGQDHGPPVAGVVQLAGHRVQVLAHALEAARPRAVGPAVDRHAVGDVLVDREQDRHRDDRRRRLDGQHGAQASERPQQAEALVEEPEAGTERRAVGTGLDVGGVVQQSIGDQEEHRHDHRDEVEAPRSDRHHGDAQRQQHATAGIGARAVADGERTQEGEDAVARQRLEDPRRPEERGQRGRERRRDDPRVHQDGPRGHPAHGAIVADERPAGESRGEHDRGR